MAPGVVGEWDFVSVAVRSQNAVTASKQLLHFGFAERIGNGL